mgnify:CR=1 FL=1
MDQLLHWKIDHPFTGVRVNSAPVAHSMAVHGVERPVVSYSIHYSVGKYTWVTDLREYHELRDGVNRIVTEYYSLDPDRVLFLVARRARHLHSDPRFARAIRGIVVLHGVRLRHHGSRAGSGATDS